MGGLQQGQGVPHGSESIPPTANESWFCRWAPARRYNRAPMVRSLFRTLMGPSRDPRMSFVSRPLPRHLPDAQVVAALELALDANPDPGYLVETLPVALREVTGHDYAVLDRSVFDVTSTYRKTQVMIRDGEVGIWPGHAARAYPMLARPASRGTGQPAPEPPPSLTSPAGKPGWAPPPPRDGGTS